MLVVTVVPNLNDVALVKVECLGDTARDATFASVCTIGVVDPQADDTSVQLAHMQRLDGLVVGTVDVVYDSVSMQLYRLRDRAAHR